MTAETLTLTDFLLARIAEDEATARAATPGPWEWTPKTDEWGNCGPDLVTVRRSERYPSSPAADVVSAWGHDAWGIEVEPGDRTHIARHDPARVLAECEAKRQIIELAAQYFGRVEDATDPGFVGGAAFVATNTLRALALPYADHPDFRDEWRP